jgi:WD40 associated region in TFIID subunit, NTD2 domain
MFQDLLLFNVADGDTRRFLEEFDRLAAWVDQSLDMYKVMQLHAFRCTMHACLCCIVCCCNTKQGTEVVAAQHAHNMVAQAEMTKVLWPVFLHCYLGLVKRNVTAEAHLLMTKHKARFTAGAIASSQHTQVRLDVELLTANTAQVT